MSNVKAKLTLCSKIFSYLRVKYSCFLPSVSPGIVEISCPFCLKAQHHTRPRNFGLVRLLVGSLVRIYDCLDFLVLCPVIGSSVLGQ